MSMDILADALLPTCESSIKSLAQFLTTLHSIDALHRLKEKADVVAAFSVIASFVPFLAPPPASAPPTTVDDDGSLVDASLERFEHRAEMSMRDRLAVTEGRQDDTTSLTHTHVLPHLPMLEDGRDDDALPAEEVLHSSQLVFGISSQRIVPLDHLIHPERQSELTSLAPKEKPLYSFLIHFPVFSAVGAKLSSVDRAEIFSLPVMAKWGFGNSMTTLAYPRLRLTSGGTACIVVDEDLGRLEEIRKDLEEAERELWDKGATGMLDRTFFLVGTWKEEHVALAFSLSCAIYRQQVYGDFERWTAPGNLWKDISQVYPILSHYQELAHGQEGVRPLLGARLFYRKQRSTWDGYDHLILTLVVPLLWSSRSLMFANDFADQCSPIPLVSNGGITYGVDVRMVKMGPPALKYEGHWDGPYLRNDKWLGVLDGNFGPSCSLR